MLNVAIVGLGNIGNTHAGVYQKLKEDVKLVAVCDLIKERADKAAEKWGAKAFYSVDEMLKSGLKIDAASVATAGKENGGDHYEPTMQLLHAGIPTLGEKPISNEIAKAKAFYSVDEMLKSGLKIDAASVATAGKENGGDHYEPTMQLLQAGIPTLGEKPISNEIAKAKEMVALGKEKKVPYGIDLNHRFTPAALRARQWLDQNRCGEINMINMFMWINNPNESSPHFHMRALHPHSFDVMRYFAGEVKKVHAFMKRGHNRQGWSNAQINLLFESGVIGHLTGSYDGGGPGHQWGLERCEIIGQDARIVLTDACELLEFQPRKSIESECYKFLGNMRSFNDTFASRIGAWVNDLKNKTPYDKIDGKAEDALKAQQIIEAAIESWESGKVVEL